MSDELFSFLEKFRLPIALTFVGLILIIGGIFASNLKESKPKQFPKDSLVQTEKVISVDVSGAVQKPGVYQLKDGSRIEEAITLAGGFTENANGEYISKYLNMAQRLSDGSKVYVPVAGESGPDVQAGTVAGSTTQPKVNINTSTQAELEALPGIGPVTASKIISDRPYQSIDELLSKKIISKKVYDQIKDNLVLY